MPGSGETGDGLTYSWVALLRGLRGFFLRALARIPRRYLMSHSLHCEVTRGCNLTCPYCYVDRTPTHELTAEIWCNLFRAFSAVGEYTFVITGGEPLLREDIVRIVRAAADHGICYLFTNCSVKRPDFGRILQCLDVVKVSVDGGTPLQYGQTRQAYCFSQVIANLREIVSEGIPHSVQVTVTPLNRDYVCPTVDALLDIGVERIQVMPALAGSATPEQIQSIKRIQSFFERVFRGHPRVSTETPVTTTSRGSCYGAVGAACGVFDQRLMITCDGWLCGCPLLSTAEYRLCEVANCGSDDLTEAVTLARTFLQRKSEASLCNACGNVTECGGWCPGVRGGIGAKCPWFCQR
jgi:MoaA/NifB/PqqE/SkfB family radical SAM enzyme